MMYFASVARTTSICLSESLAPLAMMDCQAPSNAAIKVRTASGTNTQRVYMIVEEVTHAPSGIGEATSFLKFGARFLKAANT
jgi:hypothetical protein